MVPPPHPRLHWATGDDPIVTQGGARLLCDFGDTLGLTAGLSDALAPLKQRRRGHDRGQVLTHLAVAIADGAPRVTDIAVLGRRPAAFGPVASVATTWGTLEALHRAAGLDSGFYVMATDGTLVTAHAAKEGGPTDKHGFGSYPLLAFLDGTGEPLAGILRPGHAGSGTAADHVTVPGIPRRRKSSSGRTARGVPTLSSSTARCSRCASPWAIRSPRTSPPGPSAPGKWPSSRTGWI